MLYKRSASSETLLCCICKVPAPLGLYFKRTCLIVVPFFTILPVFVTRYVGIRMVMLGIRNSFLVQTTRLVTVVFMVCERFGSSTLSRL